VSIPLTDGCPAELVNDADISATHAADKTEQTYVERLHRELALRAGLIQRWTGSDEELSPETLQSLVRIARKYALPRRWKLSEPVVTEYRRVVPSYLQWTNDIDTDAIAQA
jgi:hypothetical protein